MPLPSHKPRPIVAFIHPLTARPVCHARAGRP
jgi:hypothetical protein